MIPITRFFILAGLAICSMMATAPAEAEAQGRAVRRPSNRRVVVVSPRYYRPFYYPRHFYSGFYSPFYFSSYYHWGPGYWYGQYPYPPYGYHPPYYDYSSAARLQVTPRNAEVFIDGYFVGTVDDFDGYLQRLHVAPGEHELAIHLEGYRPFREKVLFRPGATLRVTHVMQPLAPGEATAARPTPDENARAQQDPGRRPAPPYGRGRGGEQSNFGTLSLRVQPDDAVVLVDGEEWERPQGEDRFTIDLSEGTHRLEVRKEGFRTYTRTIDIRRGQTFTVNVSLTTGGAVPVRHTH